MTTQTNGPTNLSTLDTTVTFLANAARYEIACVSASEARAVEAAAAAYTAEQARLNERRAAGEISSAELNALDSDAWDRTVGAYL